MKHIVERYLITSHNVERMHIRTYRITIFVPEIRRSSLIMYAIRLSCAHGYDALTSYAGDVLACAVVSIAPSASTNPGYNL